MQRVAWKAFWTVLAAVVAAAVVAVPTGLELSNTVRIPVSIGVALVLGVVFVKASSMVVHRSEMFVNVPYGRRQQIVRWIALAVVIHEVWVAAFALRPDLWVVWTFGMLMFVLVEYATARGLQYLLVKVKPRGEIEPAVQTTLMAADGSRHLDEYEQKFAHVLRLAQLSYLVILRYETIGTPVPFGVVVWVRKPSFALAARTGKGTKGPAVELTRGGAEAIAIAMQEASGTEMMSDYVQVQKTPAAGTYTITLVVEDVMARVYPYVEDPGYASIHDPAPVGYAIDGATHYLYLKQHGQAIGGSTWGKSSFIHAIIAYVTKCPDAVLWICGTQKLYDLVAGWLEPFMDTDAELPIDWVCNGIEDVLAMQVAAMNVARWRQDVPMAERGNWKTVIVIMDEASFPLSNSEAGVEYEGIPSTASKMAENINRGANSGDVHAIYASQRSTNGDYGDNGGDSTANIGWSAAFRSNDQAEVGRLTGDYSLPMPRHRGQYWLNASEGQLDGELAVNLKAPYLQTVDPSKPKLHNGLTISDVARARSDMRRFGGWGLDAGSAQAAGPRYAQRHRRMDLAYQNYLRGRNATPSQLQTGTGGPERQLPSGAGELVGVSKAYVAGASNALDMLREAGVPILRPDGTVIEDPASAEASGAESAAESAQPVSEPVSGASEPPANPAGGYRAEGAFVAGPADSVDGPKIVSMASVSTLEGRQTRADRVLEILAEQDRPIPRSVLMSELHEAYGDECDPQSLTNVLTKLVNREQIRRVGKDGYERTSNLPEGD